MNRRTVVASIGAVATATLAGCASFGPGETETVEYHLELTVQNDHDRSYDVLVGVTDADETAVFEESFTLGPGEGRGLGDDFPAGEYTVAVRLPDRSVLRSYWNTDLCDIHRVRTDIAADGHVSHSVFCQAEGADPPHIGASPPEST